MQIECFLWRCLWAKGQVATDASQVLARGCHAEMLAPEFINDPQGQTFRRDESAGGKNWRDVEAQWKNGLKRCSKNKDFRLAFVWEFRQTDRQTVWRRWKYGRKRCKSRQNIAFNVVSTVRLTKNLRCVYQGYEYWLETARGFRFKMHQVSLVSCILVREDWWSSRFVCCYQLAEHGCLDAPFRVHHSLILSLDRNESGLFFPLSNIPCFSHTK